MKHYEGRSKMISKKKKLDIQEVSNHHTEAYQIYREHVLCRNEEFRKTQNMEQK